MTLTDTTAKKPIDSSLLKKFALGGGLIGLALVSFFVFGIPQPNPAWGQLWRIKPLIITPLAGAAGATCFYFIFNLKLRGIKKALVIGVGVIGFLIALYLGVVLGLNGTMWN